MRPVCFALALVLLAFLARRPILAAPSAQTGLPDTDIVLAIDQSGSMADSDPQNLRIDAARRLVDTAAAYANSQTTRIGAVTFGAPYFPPGPQLFFPLTPATQPGLRDRFQAQTLPGTDFVSTLCLAWSAVTLQRPAGATGCPDNLPYAAALQAPPAANLRSRVVVLVTDGFPAPQGQDLAFSSGDNPGRCPSGSPGHTYMCGLINTWQVLTQATPVRLYVVGIDQTSQWFPLAEPYWRAVTGCQGETACATAVRRSADPAALANDILNAGTGDLINLCTKGGATSQCDLPASLSQIQFLVEGLNNADTVRVFNPGGVQINEPQATVARTAGVQRWQIEAPPSGLWRVESSNADANLSVSEILIRQQFVLQTDPAKPTVGSRVALDVTPDGPLQVDLPSLLGAPFQLRTQLNGGTESRQAVKLTSVGPNAFRIDGAILNPAAGPWVATLVLPVGAQNLTLGSVAFQVSAAAPSPSPSPSRSPVPSTAPAPDCSANFTPEGPTVSRYRPAFVLGYPLRFHSGQIIGAGLRGSECGPAGSVPRVRLTVSPSASDTACPASSTCVWDGKENGVGIAEVRGTLAGQILLEPSLHRVAESATSAGWEQRGSDDLQLSTPNWVVLESESYVGYWSPLLLIVLVLAGVSIYSTYQTPEVRDSRYEKPAELRQLGVYDESRDRALPLVRGGVVVWRRFSSRGGDVGVLSLRYLIAGPLVVRAVGPAAGHARPLRSSGPARDESYGARLEEWWKRTQPVILGDESQAAHAGLMRMPASVGA